MKNKWYLPFDCKVIGIVSITVNSKSSFESIAMFFNSVIFFENGFEVFKTLSKAKIAADSLCKKIDLSTADLFRSIIE